jgi:hypothetical protein
LVHREEVMPPIEPVPCRAWMSRIFVATVVMASSQETSRHGSVIRSRTIGPITRSGWVA